ncbi:MAG: signal peptidase I [Spirochaetales bacterium]|nr:signal peptidase I [Spirochaetales bacterium]
MWNSYEPYTSEKHTPAASGFLGKIAKFIAVVFVFVVLLPVFLAGTLGFESSVMEPVFKEGDRVIYSPFAYGAQVFGIRFPGLGRPMRGDLAVLQPAWYPEKSFFQHLLDPVVSFFTLRNLSATSDRRGRAVSPFTVSRVIGLPGDTIRVEQDRIFVRPENAPEFIPELSLAAHPYTIKPADLASGDPLLFQEPKEYMLLADEYFLAGDNRALFSDSRFQGPVRFAAIHGKVILRYWPFERFGSP